MRDGFAYEVTVTGDGPTRRARFDQGRAPEGIDALVRGSTTARTGPGRWAGEHGGSGDEGHIAPAGQVRRMSPASLIRHDEHGVAVHVAGSGPRRAHHVARTAGPDGSRALIRGGRLGAPARGACSGPGTSGRSPGPEPCGPRHARESRRGGREPRDHDSGGEVLAERARRHPDHDHGSRGGPSGSLHRGRRPGRPSSGRRPRGAGRPSGRPPSGQPPSRPQPSGRPPSGPPPSRRQPSDQPPSDRRPSGQPPSDRPPSGRPPSRRSLLAGRLLTRVLAVSLLASRLLARRLLAVCLLARSLLTGRLLTGGLLAPRRAARGGRRPARSRSSRPPAWASARTRRRPSRPPRGTPRRRDPVRHRSSYALLLGRMRRPPSPTPSGESARRSADRSRVITLRNRPHRNASSLCARGQGGVTRAHRGR